MSESVTPCLWFNGNAEEAVGFYTEVFPNARVVETYRYPETGPGEPGSVMWIVFELDGRRFWALNGGMDFPFSEAVSLVYACDSQAEIDRVWDRLGDGGAPQKCGWIKDRFGMPWQIVPASLATLVGGDRAAADRVLQAVWGMVKLDIAALEQAYAG
jgi:predicted 3-demethylubiquinone-9 3-methyltransferase (glyoxalase superfamily)